MPQEQHVIQTAWMQFRNDRYALVTPGLPSLAPGLIRRILRLNLWSGFAVRDCSYNRSRQSLPE